MSNLNTNSETNGGVVQNSALSFVASAQLTNSHSSHGSQACDQINQTDTIMPPGLKALYEACSKIYPDQTNPLQVTTRLKYWLGGQDPLDYISMYWNPGNPEEHIPPHWHYVSFGLSDLHGDGRVHPEPDTDQCSGYGLELTLRLEADGGNPPVWPAALLQALARYIFATGNKFCAGDHISWHAPLDGSRSRVRHLLVAEDPQLQRTDTPHGSVAFLQMVGCTSRELRAAQRGSGFQVLRAISEDPICGGKWLVTRVRRRRSAHKLTAGSCDKMVELAGVSARVNWNKYLPSADEECPLSPSVERQIKETFQRGLNTMTDRGSEGHNMSTDSFEMSSMERALPQLPDVMQGSWHQDSIEYLDGVHLMLNSEGASLLPLAIRGRILHNSHFTWRQGPRSVTVLTPRVLGAFTTPQKPYAVRGSWLQILIPKDLAEDMAKKVSSLSSLAEIDSETDEEGDATVTTAPTVPYTITWPAYKLKISVLPDTEFL
ncbi:suppressor of fused homolog [Leptidea sinapis]|uniref:Suppressor of fused homolog n=1 Tax=Leptidea sinapis TaxID=189913 RepID=A0A5E4R0X3_9NEOP|nr:suppressor of fused homolog [Leptidea sinapis]VVD03963.1 unnamed protein product [Leptidea sinapis]